MFGFIVNLFNTFLYIPLFNVLILIYNYLPKHDFGLAIILLTIVIRIILYPLSIKALHSQKILQKLQPRLDEIKQKHKHNKEKQAQETLDLYKNEKINPFSGLFLIIVQFPILIALYQVFSQGLKPEELSHLYNFVVNPLHINSLFFGFLDLSKPNLIMAIIASILQFFQTKMVTPKSSPNKPGRMDITQMMQKQMIYFFPFLTVVILVNLPSALALYWIVSGLFSIVQQYFILKDKKQIEISAGK